VPQNTNAGFIRPIGLVLHFYSSIL